MSTPMTVEFDLHVERRGHGARKELREGLAPAQPVQGRIPRVTRLTALAIRFDKMIASGQVRDYAQLALLGRVTRARVSQIVSLMCLAPDIIEELLHLSPVEVGRDPIILAKLLPISRELEWSKQRRLWQSVRARFNAK